MIKPGPEPGVGPFAPAPLTALEIAYGSALETGPPPARSSARADRTPPGAVDAAVLRRLADAAREALVDAIRPTLQQGPCLVSFSGGMDSSFVLAVAADLAHREGLPAPVPIVLRFTDAPLADETHRQNDVLDALRSHSRIADPVVETVDDELDLLGPVARRMLDLVGPQVPANMYTHLPLLTAAAGGGLLTGFGGDQLIGGHGRRFGPRARVLAALPVGLESAIRRTDDVPWLQPDAARRCRSLLAARRRWRLLPPRQRIAREAGSRFTALAHHGLVRLAGCCGARIGHPLFDATFLARLADLLEVLPPTRRAPLYRLLAGDRLPAVVTEPHPKAVLSEAFHRSATAEAVASFDPDRLPVDVRELVDVDRLLSVWRSRGPVRSNGLLLHVVEAAAAQPISPLSPLPWPAEPGAG